MLGNRQGRVFPYVWTKQPEVDIGLKLPASPVCSLPPLHRSQRQVDTRCGQDGVDHILSLLWFRVTEQMPSVFPISGSLFIYRRRKDLIEMCSRPAHIMTMPRFWKSSIIYRTKTCSKLNVLGMRMRWNPLNGEQKDSSHWPLGRK